MLSRLAPWLFVVIWSSGFVAARGIRGVIDPYAFLLVRFTCVTLVFLLVMQVLRLPWPERRSLLRLMGIGVLVQGLYLGPGFWAVGNGLEAGVMSLMGSMQPPLTAALAWWVLAERPTRQVLIGLALGVMGVLLAVSPSLGQGKQAAGAFAVLAGVISILSITAGTLLQRSSVISVHLVSASAFQALGATFTIALLMPVFGHWVFPINVYSVGYLVYAVFVLSVGGFTLLMWMVRQGSATHASSLLFLVPPLAAMAAWLLFDEPLSAVQLAGFALALAGVVLARRSG